MKHHQKTVTKIIEYIEEHLGDNIHLKDIAKETGYSKYHLNRIFTKSTGQTIHKYLQERRLTESAKMLISSDKPLAEIALESGYSTQQAYTLAFRQYYLCTPQVYRKVYQPIAYRNTLKINRKLYYKFSVLRCLTVKGGMAA